jgi:hypothetical protein
MTILLFHDLALKMLGDSTIRIQRTLDENRHRDVSTSRERPVQTVR